MKYHNASNLVKSNTIYNVYQFQRSYLCGAAEVVARCVCVAMLLSCGSEDVLSPGGDDNYLAGQCEGYRTEADCEGVPAGEGVRPCRWIPADANGVWEVAPDGTCRERLSRGACVAPLNFTIQLACFPDVSAPPGCRAYEFQVLTEADGRVLVVEHCGDRIDAESCTHAGGWNPKCTCACDDIVARRAARQ